MALAPNRRQAIIWTNADPIHWRIYAVLGGDELTALNLLMFVINLGKDLLPIFHQALVLFRAGL